MLVSSNVTSQFGGLPFTRPSSATGVTERILTGSAPLLRTPAWAWKPGTPCTWLKRKSRSRCSCSKRSVTSVTEARPQGVSSLECSTGATNMPTADCSVCVCPAGKALCPMAESSSRGCPALTMVAEKLPRKSMTPCMLKLKERPSASSVAMAFFCPSVKATVDQPIANRRAIRKQPSCFFLKAFNMFIHVGREPFFE